MIYLISYSNRYLCTLLLILLLAGCSGVKPGPPPLEIDTLQLTLQGEAREKISILDWRVATSGGQGGMTYEFRSRKLGVESLEHRGSIPTGNWSPNKSGSYTFKVIVTDKSDDTADSGWSQAYRFRTAVNAQSLYAVLPIENLSDSRAPLTEIRKRLIDTLADRGITLLADEPLETFMKKYRMRHVGGISTDIGRQLKAETGVEGVFITSLETWQDSLEPRISLISRVVTTGEQPEVVWIDSIGLTGGDAPALLGIGKIKDYRQLLSKAFARLLDSFQAYLDEEALEFRYAAEPPHAERLNTKRNTADEALKLIDKRHQPQFFYRASTFDPAAQYQVAVIPFLNINARKHAGKIVALHTVKQLSRYSNLQVFEPGLVRETLLRYRMIMQSGPSLAASDILASKNILGADIIVSGRVFDYQGDVGESKVDFSMQAFDGSKREVIWASRSYATGNDAVYFFNWGKVPSAHGLTSRMTQAVIRRLEE